MARGRPAKETRESKSRNKISSDEYTSQFYIDPANLDNEHYHYRFVETHCMNAETQSIEKAVMGGYEPVKLSELPEFAKTSELLSEIRGRGKKDEYVRRGDQILMRCPRAQYLRAKKQERDQAKFEMSRLEWAEQSSSIKAPTFVTENYGSRSIAYSKEAQQLFAPEDE